MGSLEGSINALYYNKDLILDSSRLDSKSKKAGKNLAVACSAETELISFNDSEIHHNGELIFIPGRNYLISFKELANVMTFDKAILTNMLDENSKNLAPRLVLHSMFNHDPMHTLAGMRFSEYDRNKFESWLKHELKSFQGFAKICKERYQKREIDSEGLVWLKNVDPVIPLVGACFGDKRIYHEERALMKINSPLEIKAREAEFRFQSEEGVKVSDGDTRVGIYEKGIMTFHDVNMVVLGLKENLQDIRRFSYSYAPFSRRVFRYFVLSGLVSGAIVAAIRADSHLNGVAGAICGSITGAVLYGFVNGLRKKRITYDTGKSKMKIAFYGTVPRITPVMNSNT